jgi:hypothetical protein
MGTQGLWMVHPGITAGTDGLIVLECVSYLAAFAGNALRTWLSRRSAEYCSVPPPHASTSKHSPTPAP